MMMRGKAIRSTALDPSAAPLSTPATLATVPDPYEGVGAGDLTPSERAHLAVCEDAVRGLQSAFWVAGKALALISKARLYRETHETFAAYLDGVWAMSTSAAYRLIEQWPLAERMSPIGDTGSGGPLESHVRVLLPAAKAHGADAALALYDEARAVLPKVTAAGIRAAVQSLPARLPEGEDQAAAVREHTRRTLVRRSSGEPAAAPEAEDGPEQAAQVVRAEQALAALRIAGRQLRGTVLADALAADPVRGAELAEEAGRIAGEITGRVERVRKAVRD
jgi:hypothetical protein